VSVAAAARAHTRAEHAQMLAWLRECDEHDLPAPTDDAIAHRFCFHTYEQARTLLADLADTGAISIRYADGGRTVSLGKDRRALASVLRPEPAVRKRQLDVDAGVSKIMRIISGGKGAPPEPAPIDRLAERKASKPRKKQVNIHVSGPLLEAIEKAADGEPLSVVVRMLLEERLLRPPEAAAPHPKPLIKAHVAAHASEHGLDLHQFVGLLIERGFSEWMREQGR
jgi:hypothetical protein